MLLMDFMEQCGKIPGLLKCFLNGRKICHFHLYVEQISVHRIHVTKEAKVLGIKFKT